MRLTQLKLAGFKSFVEPTVIPTPSHLVGIVGPNGCGKSNIIDAVRWVMGESRAAELRGESMQDVIFNGSGNRKPAARASVELVFDNSEQRAAGQWGAYSEISVRRVLTRDGASSYFINNQRVRRRDVHDIFLGTGLGARGYAIIGQGMINRLIEARPEELRIYLEEAAGVSRYRERRRETEGRLRETRDNLTRVEDILRELTTQLERLESQAQVARQYRQLQSEAEQKQQLLWFVRERQARDDQGRRQRDIEQAQVRLEAALAGLRAAEAALESRRQAHYEASDTVHAAQGRLFEAGALVSRLEAEIRHVREARERLQQRRHQLQAQTEQWAQQQSHCAQQIDTAQLEMEEAHARHEDVLQRLDEASADLPDIESAVRQAAGERETMQRSLARSEQELALLHQAQGSAQRQLDALELRRARLQQALDDLQLPDPHALERVDGERQVLEARLNEARDALLALEGQLPQHESVSAQARVRAQSAEHEAARLQARLDALTSLQNNVLSKSELHSWLADSALDGEQPLWRSLQVQPGWETALEAVLLERTGALPVSDLAGEARRLGDSAPPARLALYQPADESDMDASGLPGLTTLASFVEVREPGSRAAVQDWLWGVHVAADLQTALALRDRLPRGHCCVVAEGHIVDRHSVRFYAADSEQAGVLARQQDIDNLERDLKAGRLLAQAAADELEQAEAALHGVRQSLAPARTRVAELTERLHQVEMDHTRLEQTFNEVSANVVRLQDELSELAVQHEDLVAAREENDMRVGEVTARVDADREALEQAREAGEELFGRMEQRRQAVRDLERQAQEADYGARTLRARIEELMRTQQVAREQAQRADAELSDVQGELFELDESTVRASLDDALAQRTTQEDALRQARIAQDGLAATLREADEQRLQLEQSIEPLRARITDLQLKEQAARLAVEQFAGELDSRQVDRSALQTVLDAASADWQDSAWLQAELQRLGRQIGALGAVNLAALDELHSAQERQTFLNAQFEDLSAAIATLEDAIRKIDRETRELLQATFTRVNENFGELFPQLFGGGEARLLMTGEEILDAGVQVMAQPPGKRNSTIQLLSGGEKALTAIALVFALFRLNPAPFCLLDEVDAPLDDANTERYARLVTAMSEQTQFLFISHNKIAMQMAKLLVGVTMQEQGVSRIVAVDMDAALEMADAQGARI